MAKKSKQTPDQKILLKLMKQWDMPCECTHGPVEHVNGMCTACQKCVKYTPVMSVDIVKKEALNDY